jgi:hypothetical protein
VSFEAFPIIDPKGRENARLSNPASTGLSALKRRRTLVTFGIGAVVLLCLGAAGLFYLGSHPRIHEPSQVQTDPTNAGPAKATTASGEVFTDRDFGITFQSPPATHATYQTEQPAPGEAVLTITFTDAAGRYALMSIIRSARPLGVAEFEDAVREVENDTAKRLRFTACPMRTLRPCLRVEDQEAWIDSGHFPLYTEIYILGDRFLYGVVPHGQTDTLGIDPWPILSTLNTVAGH